jgi:hypothetical protein
MVGLYKSNAVDPSLESARFQRSNLSSDFLVSKFAFKFNLYRYSAAMFSTAATVGGCTAVESSC